jgi:flagellin
MALGVLNNLSAIYAENNLNNTNNSLQTVLQQLSSGSKINSGADDAAGLSLVNGLQANQTALTQSETNATEGVGLLQVADGALLQVTSLLDRAVTLATEASNGTLNSTQESAANQEYQSILSEINNIGSTTTYNQEQVFAGNTIAIYTGDSSTTGSSIDNLYIRPLSSANVGDSAGKISYSSGANNVFINLSHGGINAAVTDSLGGASTTITVDYMTSGASGSATSGSAQITVGAGTTYANTAQGLIDAINNCGLGLSATFATATQGGTAAVASAIGQGTETGIQISGVGVGTGTAPGLVGTLNIGGLGGVSTDDLSGSLNIEGANGQNSTIALGAPLSTDTLTDLADTINSGGYGITAKVVGSTLTFTSSNSSVSISGISLADATHPATGTLSLANIPTSVTHMTTLPGSIGTMTIGGGGAPGDTLGGTMDIMGANGILDAITISAGNANNTLATLATYINAQNIGVTATLGGSTLTLASISQDSTASFNAADAAGVTDVTTPAATFAVANTITPPVAYYSTGVSGTVTDTSTGGGTLVTGMTTDTNGKSGITTISYSDSAGTNLSSTDLTDQSDAEEALTAINMAISASAALDGYVGGQINTLNSISSVMSTQQENVVSAQNAIQATDYASATSNMSKYEILSQTGIAALAQANSVQQEVTKLLQ